MSPRFLSLGRLGISGPIARTPQGHRRKTSRKRKQNRTWGLGGVAATRVMGPAPFLCLCLFIFFCQISDYGGCEQVANLSLAHWPSLSLSLGFRKCAGCIQAGGPCRRPAGHVAGQLHRRHWRGEGGYQKSEADGLDTPVPWAQTSMHSVLQSHLCLKTLFKGCQMSKGRMHSLGNYQRFPEGWDGEWMCSTLQGRHPVSPACCFIFW